MSTDTNWTINRTQGSMIPRVNAHLEVDGKEFVAYPVGKGRWDIYEVWWNPDTLLVVDDRTESLLVQNFTLVRAEKLITDLVAAGGPVRA